MTRARQRRRILGVVSGALVAALVAVGLVAAYWYHATERTYYGPHTDLLRVGERITVSREFRMRASQPIAEPNKGVVQSEPAWDEDSCYPDRSIKIALTSGEAVAVPRHFLHRE